MAPIDRRVLPMGTVVAIVVAVSLAAIALVACGGTARNTGSQTQAAATSASPPPPIVAHVAGQLRGDEDDDDSPSGNTGSSKNDNDADFDNDTIRQRGYYDADDGPARNFGHAASAADRRAIGALVKRYLIAAVRDDGATACKLFYSLHAEAIPEDYGEGEGPTYLRGKTCAVVMTKLFAHFRSQIVGSSEIVAIRVEGNEAHALLGSATLPARYLRLQREMGVWKVYDMIGKQLP